MEKFFTVLIWLVVIVLMASGCVWFLNFSWNYVFGDLLTMDYVQSLVFLALLYFIGRVWS